MPAPGFKSAAGGGIMAPSATQSVTQDCRLDMANEIFQGMYRDLADQVDDRIEEHNRIVKSFEGPEGQTEARAAFDYWDTEYSRIHTGDSYRMRSLAAGLAAVEEPWMSDIGYLTQEDRNHLMHFRSLEKPDPELDKLRNSLWDRQEKEAQALADKQADEKLRVGPSQPLVDQHLRERDSQITAFIEERARYVREYREAKRLAAEIQKDEQEKSESLKHQDEWGKGPGYSP